MTDEVENVLRETFRAKESLVASAPQSLAWAARGRAARRRRATWLAVGGATAAVLVGAGVLVPRGAADVGGTGSDRVAAAPPSASAPAGALASASAGWRLESSLGVQLEVPADWTVNDYDCQMGDSSTVVRGFDAVRACLRPEPRTKQLVIVADQQPDRAAGLAERPVTIDGVPGTRAEGRWSDGRAAGWIWLPSRQALITVRTLARATTGRILDSVRPVDVDHLGCPARQPAVAPARSDGGPMLPDRPDGIVICNYYGHGERLVSSTALTGAAAATLAAAVNAARPGRNPDVPGDKCGPRTPALPDLMLIAGDARVWVTFSTCTGRGVTDGVRQAQVSRPLVDLMMRPLSAGYGYLD